MKRLMHIRFGAIFSVTWATTHRLYMPILAFVVCASLLSAQAATFRLEDATIDDINRAFDAGMLTSEELVQLYLNRIEAYDDQGPALNAIISLNPNALSTAAALDQERRATGPRGPLHGIPVLLKDNYDFFGMPTTAGARALAESYPPDDAFQVQRLREAGAVILGKANLHEFAIDFDTTSSLGGQTLNPYDALPNSGGSFVIPGGSSGGTGAAIAASFATLGTGTDTGGSIRVPSAFNNLVGIKPTMGLTSRDGIVPLFLLRDVGGPMTKSVSDAAYMLDVLAGYDPADPATAASIGQIPSSYTDSLDSDGLRGARIGLMWRLPGNAAPHPDVEAAVNAAISDIQALGAETVTPVYIPFTNTWYNSFEHDVNNYLRSLGDEAPMHSLSEIVASREYLSEHHWFLNNWSLKGEVSPEQDPAYQTQLQRRENLRTAILEVMDAQDLDAILYPTATQPPPLYSGPGFLSVAEVGLNTNLAAFSGFPAITFPGGFTSDGLPIGIELMGRPFSEPTLISLAYSYEQATHHRQAPLTTPPLPGETIREFPILTAAATGGWDAADTWDDGTQTPTDAYDVVVGGHTVTVTGNAKANSLEITETAGKLAVDAGAVLDLTEWLTVTVGSNVEIVVGGESPGQINAGGNVFANGGKLNLTVDGADPFKAGTYSLVTSAGPTGILGYFIPTRRLGAYVSQGTRGDGLENTGTEVTLTIDFDLNPGDATLNKTTDLTDFNIWNANKFTSGTDWRAGDFNGDGTTDLSDFNIWNAHKFTVASGGAAPAPTQVPEPGTLALLGCALAGMAVRWRRRKRVALLVVASVCLVSWPSEPAHAQLPGIGAIGDSYTDEYYPLPWSGSYGGDTAAMSWLQQLVLSRGPDSALPEMGFGSYESNRTVRWTPRYNGYEYNWARTGATTHTLLSEGQHTGVAAQVSSGEVDFVAMLMGGNDFGFLNLGWYGGIYLGLSNVYAPIYSQQTPFIGSDGRSYDTVDDYVASIVDRYATAVDTVAGAGAQMILGTLVDYGNEPWTLTRFPDPNRRQHITDAVAAVNKEIRAICAERGIYGVDFNGLLGQYHSLEPLVVGGIEIVKAQPSSPNPYYFFLPDGGHPGTVVQGLVANAFIEAINECYGTEFTPLSDQEILVNAGIPDPGGTPTYFDVTPFVIVPEPSILTAIATGDWDAADTWDDGTQTPTDAYDVVVESHTVTVTENAAANSLQITEADGKLIVDARAVLDLTKGLTMVAGSQLGIGLAGTAPGRIEADGNVSLDGELELRVNGDDPFKAGTYTLISSGGPGGILGTIALGTDLNAYVTAGIRGDGLHNTGTEVTLTIDLDLNPGDADLSTATDLSDFNLWNAHKFMSDTDWATGDFDGNGVTDLSDFNIWNAHKFTVASGGAAPSPTEVPEPSSLVLLILASASFVGFVRRRRS